MSLRNCSSDIDISNMQKMKKQRSRIFFFFFFWCIIIIILNLNCANMFLLDFNLCRFVINVSLGRHCLTFMFFYYYYFLLYFIEMIVCFYKYNLLKSYLCALKNVIVFTCVSKIEIVIMCS